MFAIATFYRFHAVEDPEALQSHLLGVAAEDGVKGSILVAPEGVNGTISGDQSGVASVLAEIHSVPGFEDMDVTWSHADEDPFLRLKVRLKQEIVTLGVGDVDVEGNTGTKVPPDQWNELIADPDVVVIDTRNAYEIAIGSFSGAIDPGTRSFRQFPEWLAGHRRVQADTRIAMFCTGGIRCEKATAYLKEQGFENVFQLEGGILRYLEATAPEDSAWVGECYVFDRRVSVGHGLEPGDREICPNCNTVVGEAEKEAPGYLRGVACTGCHDTITPDRRARFSERQRQIELAEARGTSHLGRTP